MKILIADDDVTSKRILEAILTKAQHEVVATDNGKEAWAVMQGQNPPPLAIIDWIMPGLSGVEFCRRVRESVTLAPTYIILLTIKRFKEHLIEGLEAGANDYIRKPFDREELVARVNVGERVVKLQSELVGRMKELQEALSRIKILQGILPLCSYCKKIRVNHDRWQSLEAYLSQNSEAEISHGVCPDCMKTYLKPQLEKIAIP